MKRTFTSVSDVLRSAWANVGALVSKPKERTDRIPRSTRLEDEIYKDLHAEQAARHFSVTGILLDKGKDCFDFSLQLFCQKIYRTGKLTGDDIVRSIVSERV